jgi:hypothetical protein
MALEINGKLVKVMEQVTGEGRNGGWVKQEFVIETFDQYPKKICCAVWGDKTEQLRRFQPGDDVKVSINLESREYNERWFTEVRAWKLDPAGTVSAAPAQGAPSYSAPTPPAQGSSFTAPGPGQNFQSAQPNQAPFFEPSSDDSNDLPF